MMRLETLPLRHPSYSGYISTASSTRRGSMGGLDTGGLGEYLRRILDYQQMDFEAAFEDITMLCSPNPQRVYKMASYRKHTKNHWARDDPAFAVVEMVFLIWASLAYGLAFHARGPTSFLLIVLRGVLFDWLLVGLVVATACRWIANRYLLRLRSHSVEQEVEWSYAFDIHCNASLPYILLTSVVQYFLLPFLLSRSLVALVVSNLLYSLAFTLYFYITHLGYRALPFLHKTEVFLYPTTVSVFLFVLFLTLGLLGESYRFQGTRIMASLYFSH